MDSSEIMVVLTTLAKEIRTLNYWLDNERDNVGKLTTANTDLKLEIAKLKNELDSMRIQMEVLKRG